MVGVDLDIVSAVARKRVAVCGRRGIALAQMRFRIAGARRRVMLIGADPAFRVYARWRCSNMIPLAMLN